MKYSQHNIITPILQYIDHTKQYPVVNEAHLSVKNTVCISALKL